MNAILATGSFHLLADRSYMPPSASTYSGMVDFWFDFILWCSLFFFVLMNGLTAYFAIRYRRKPGAKPHGPTHSNTLELAWTIIPAILVAVMFIGGFHGFMDMYTPPENGYDIAVTGQQWNWTFTYPNGHTDSELHVPANTPIRLTLDSVDVLHSLFIPAFRAKMDAVPGRYTKMWFEATRPGTYNVFCAEYCGTSHSDMTTVCIVHPTMELYKEWLASADPFSKKNMSDEQFEQYVSDPAAFIAANPEIKNLLPLDKMGEILWKKKGCNACHSVDGTANIGPTWKGLWGKTEEFTDGTSVTIKGAEGDNYIRESIVNPLARIVKGYPGSMPTYQGRITDREITALIWYIRSLNSEQAK